MENGAMENGSCGFSKPVVSAETARKLLRRLYGIRQAELTEFSSYDDVAYRVRTTAPGREGPDGGRDFVLKVLNATVTSHGPGAVAAQTAVLDHLRNFPGLRCQVPVANVRGDLVSFEMVQNDRPWEGRSEEALSAVRMYRFLPGQVLWDASPLPLDLFFVAGRHLGDLQLALQTFPGDSGPLRAKASVHMFSLENVPALERHLGLVRDPGRRRLVMDVLAAFQSEVLPVQGQLRKGIVHHDFNEHNVLVEPVVGTGHGGSQTGGQPPDLQVCGVLDFDEMVHTCLVYEIAVSMMYLGMCSEQPLEAMGRLLAGFESRAPLPPAERRLLRPLIAARYAQSLLIGLFTAALHPNDGYVLSTQIKGWSRLELLWSKSEAELAGLWDGIASGLTDAPTGPTPDAVSPSAH